MRDHEQFGRPPHLRPRSAGVSRASLRSLAPEQLVREASNGENAAMLHQRLQVPRPGSAAPPRGRLVGSAVISEGTMQPTALLSKPPMRPKSAAMGANDSRRGVSQHRMDCIKHVERSNNQEAVTPPSSVPSSLPHQPRMASQLQRAAEVASRKEDHISAASSAGHATSTSSLSRHSLKRPFSAASSLPRKEQDRDSSSLRSQQIAIDHSVLTAQPSGQPQLRAKRPLSAAPALQARDGSFSKSPLDVTTEATLAKTSHPEIQSRTQLTGVSNSAIAIMRSFHRDTFVYAVPKHCFERGRQYNPYDIVIVSHEALFGPDLSSRAKRDALFDYYTISATGMTFHCKDDNYEPSFFLSDEWERQKANFTAICQLPTFQLFRYRKAFFGWKKWIRSKKIENARSVLSSSLYFAQPLLLDGMNTIHQELLLLGDIDLMSDPEGITHHVSQFSSKSSEHVQRQGIKILETTGRIQQTLLDVCRKCLNSAENPLGGYPGHQFALSTRRSSNFHIFEAHVERQLALATADQQLIQHDHFQSTSIPGSQVKISPSKAGLLRMTHRKHLERQIKAKQRHPQDALDKIRWTMAAIQRRRCHLLAKFVALVDFMTVDALHGILTRSIQMARDTLWVGANAVPISRLLDRKDYVQAFHKMLRSRHETDESLSTSQIDSRYGKSNWSSVSALNKQQAKRVLRSAGEPKMAALLRSQMRDPNEPSDIATGDRTDQLRTSAAVWLESHLDSFFFHSLAERHGEDADVYSFDDILLVLERDLSQALVLPDFNTSMTDVHSSATVSSAGLDETEAATESAGAALQQIESLSPIPLFHMSIALHVDPPSRKCDVAFTPPLDRITWVINESLNGFIELFRGIPAIVTHQELRAILEFADDYRAPFIGQGSTTQYEADPQGNEEEDDDNASRWNKSNYERLFARINTDNYCTMLRINIEELIASAVSGVEAFAKKYDDALATYSRNERINFDDFRSRFRRQEYSLKEMELDAQNFSVQMQELEKLKEEQMIEFIQLDTTKLIEALKPSPARCLQNVHALYPAFALERCELFLGFVRSACRRIEKPHGTTDLEAFTKYLLNIHKVQDDAQEKEFDLAFLQDMRRMLERLEIAIPPDIAQTFDLCEPEFESLKAQLTESMARRDADIRDYSPLLQEQVKALCNGIERLKTSSGEQAVNSGENKSREARDLADTLEKQAELLTKQSAQLVWVQRVFTEFSSGGRPPLEEFSDLRVLASELKLKNELWEAVNDVEKYLEVKQDETLRDIDLGQLRDISSNVHIVIKRLHDSHMQISAVKRLEQCKQVLEGLSPVIRDLRNETLEDRHWTKLEHKMDCSFVRLVMVDGPKAPGDTDEPLPHDDDGGNLETTKKQMKEVRFLDLPLRHLLEVDAVSHSAIIHQVAEEATAEAAIAKSFYSVAQTWETREIPSHAKKDREGRDAVCLGDCTEIMTLLEESEVLLRVMESSSYARVIHSKLFKLLQDLAVTKETMDLLTVCQQKWEYLQRLISVDFVRSFPDRSKLLQQHDANWKAIMEGIFKRPLCLPFGTNGENRQIIQAILAGFESAAKYLDQHLEMKRQSFPGFYKLSNAEFGTLLSKVRDINNIQQFLYQCFDNVGRINFGTREACQDILSITSRSFPHAETIQMGKNLKARGPPEQWLVAVERRLIEMLRKGTKNAITLLSQVSTSGTTPFDVSTLNAIPLQSIILADRILRCELVESSLTDDNEANQAVVVHAKLCQYGNGVCDRVNGGAVRDGTLINLLSTRDILLFSALRLHEIEFRDAIDEHFAHQSPGGASHGGLGVQWQLQMKHRFDDSTTVGYDCHVELDGMRVSYGFNYVNINTELVFTPRTMRYVFSILTAARHAQAVMINGVESAGKQSIALQISRHFGRRFFGLAASETSSPSTSYYQVAHCLKLLRGALQSGAILYIALPKHDEALNLLRILSSHFAQIEHSVLCKLPITCLQKAPILWTPGTALLFAYRTPPPSTPHWVRLHHEIEIAAAAFCSVAVVPDHDLQPVLEAFAYSNRLEAHQRIAQNLSLLWRHLALVMTQHGFFANFFTMRTAKRVLSSVAKSMCTHTDSFEREALQDYLLCECVLTLCRPHLDAEHPAMLTLLDSIDHVFQHRQHEHEWYAKQWRRKKRSSGDAATKKLQDFVDEAAQELQFVPRSSLLTSAVEVAKGLAASTSVVIAGPSGVGKTTTYTVLASALDLWKTDVIAQNQSLKTSGSQQPEVASSGGAQKNIASEPPMQPQGFLGKSSFFVTTRVVLPTSLTIAQFIGSAATDAKGQINSLLGRLIREAQDNYALSTDHEIRLATGTDLSVVPPTFGPLLAFQKLTWIVFDGAHSCGGAWLDVLVSALGRKFVFGMMDSCDNPSRDFVRFADGEFMMIPPNLRFLFETWSLDNATPAVLRESSIVVLKNESEVDIGKDDDSLPIYYAYIQRFIEQHRAMAMSAASDASAPSWGILTNVVYETIMNRLMGSDILSKIYAVMEDYGIAVKLTLLERVEYLMSILQALLNTVGATCSSSRKHEGNSISATIPEEDVRQRVEMAILYSLTWGFGACSGLCQDESRRTALQYLISGILKSHFDMISHTWEECGRECNLFDLLIDINGLRFVSLESGDTMILRDKIWRHSVSQNASLQSSTALISEQQFHSLYVPTTTSLIVHAAMKEAIRSARGVLLIGDDTSRKTMLLQNFLKQLETLRILTTSNYASIPQPTTASSDAHDSHTRRKRAIPLIRGGLFPNSENTYASLDRIRLHQVGLVKRLAKRFRKVNTAAAALAAANRTFGAAKYKNATGSSADETEKKAKATKKDQDWMLPPHLDQNKSGMIAKFDLGDFVPFYFAMNQHDGGVQELARCLERMLQRERSGVFEPPPGKIAVLIIDDLHLPVESHDEEHPSCHEYLRSAHEYGTVLTPCTDTSMAATPITIGNLMMVASIRPVVSRSEGVTQTRHGSLDKLVKRFLPVYAPPCSLLELHSIFHTLMVTHWERISTAPLEKLPSVVRQTLPIVVAATTALWAKMRRRASSSHVFNSITTPTVFDLHDLCRVYTGMCAVEPTYVLDRETLFRLLAHEVTRSFGDTLGTPQARTLLRNDVLKIRILLDELDHNHTQRMTKHGGSATTNAAMPSASSKAPDSVRSTAIDDTKGGEQARATNLNTGTNATGLLTFFMNELMTAEKKSGSEHSMSAQQRLAYERKRLHIVGLWAIVPSSLYYQFNLGGQPPASNTGTGGSSQPLPLQRRNSVRFLRRMSMENIAAVTDNGASSSIMGGPTSGPSRTSSLGTSRWIYAEIPLTEDEDGISDEELQAIQNLFSAIRFCGSLAASQSSKTPVSGLHFQIQLAQPPRNAHNVTPLMVRNIAKVERVCSPPGCRIALLGFPGCGRELMLRYSSISRPTTQQQSIWTVEGVSNENIMIKKWKHVVHQLFHRVGVGCETVTLVVKRLQCWPKALLGQLLALMVAGEIPDAFTLEEQIKLATRVRDERLIEMEQRHQAQIARVRQEVELQKEAELLARKDDLDSSHGRSKASTTALNQELEKKYQHALLVKLGQVQLRHQQEMDDFLRKCEVENESVTATIMSLMRPLGMTSGKWQQIVQRMRRRLKVALVVDFDEHPLVLKAAPQIFHLCNLATLSPLDLPSLSVALFGTYRAELQSAFSLERSGLSNGPGSFVLNSVEDRADFVRVIDHVEHELAKVVALAARMHTAAKALALRENRHISTEQALITPRFFTRVLRYYYHKERELGRKAEWFSYVYTSMQKALWKLQDLDGELRAQLEACDQQIEVSQELLLEQQEDCNRIRDMMKRYQEAAEEQVQVTNEMEQRAQGELLVPLACLEEANAALLMIDKRHVIEIKSFNSPPLLVHLVLDAICVMFSLEPTWENARKILSDSNVVHTLLTFDKDNISSEILTKLEMPYINDPRFRREEVEKQSVAASMMVVWVRAMYQYATARRQVLPTLEKLEQAQSRLRLLMQEYQVSKQRVVEADEALAKTKETLAKAQELRKQTVDEMESRHTRLAGGRVVLEFLTEDKREADKTSQRLQKQRALGLTWWNALLSAGAIAYARYFDAPDRLQLFEEWVKAYHRVVTPARTVAEAGCAVELTPLFVPAISMSIKNSQSESTTGEADNQDEPHESLVLFDESHRYWEFASACGFLFSKRNLQDAFLLTQTAMAAFPVVLVTSFGREMEELLLKGARYLWRWSNYFMISAKAADLESTLLAAIRDGHQLLILDVDPLDVEYQLGSLWWLFHWNSVPGEGGLGAEQLITGKDCENQVGDSNSNNAVAVHPSFRAILATHQNGSLFGDSLLTQVPVVDARVHTSEVTDVILDKLWHPGLFEGGQHGFGLKRSVRDFDRLHRQYEDAQAQLTKLIQGAAVRGEFQREETEVIRNASSITHDLRVAIAAKKQEIRERVQVVLKHQTFARLGAAIYSAINGHNTYASLSLPVECRRLSFQMFLPMFLAALKKPVVSVASSGMSMLARRTSSSDPGLKFRSTSRLVMLTRQHKQPSSRLGTMPSARGSGFDSISEILTKVLHQLMPLLQDTSDWYKFLAHMLWFFERQYPVENLPYAPALQAAATSLDSQVSQSNEPSVHRLLSMIKLSHWKSQAVCEDYIVLPDDVQDPDTLITMVVNGHAMNAGAESTSVGLYSANSALPSVFAASRCRAERVKTMLSMYPRLLRLLCDRILLVYGVQVRFSVSHQEVVADSSSIEASSHGLLDDASLEDLKNAQANTGWLRLLRGLPEATFIAIRSEHAFGSYQFLHRIFHATTATQDVRLTLLKAIIAKVHRTSSDLDALYVIPNDRLRGGSKDERGSLSLSVGETALMINDLMQLTQMDKDKLEAFMDDALLTIVNLQTVGSAPCQATHWEDMYHLMLPTPQATTSTELRRFEGGHAARLERTHSTTSQQAGTAGKSGGAVALTSPSRSTARRFSTNLHHRRSDDAAGIMSATRPPTKFVGAISHARTVPAHLRDTMVMFAAEPTELGTDRTPSFKQCIRETLVRVAYHPCGDMLRQILDAQNSSEVATKLQFAGNPTEGSSGLISPFKMVWHYLTALVVYHSILAYRWQLTLRQYIATSAVTSPSEQYSWDVLITALDQLLHLLLQSCGTKASQLRAKDLLTRVKQQVFLSTYSRQAKTQYEVTVVRTLCHECLWLVHDSVDTGGSDDAVTQPSVSSSFAMMANAPGITSSRSVRSQRLVRMNSLSSNTSTIAAPPSGLLSFGASSRKVFCRRHSSLGDQAQPLLTDLKLPFEDLRNSVQQVESWLDVMWKYAAQVDGAIESHLRDIFGLIIPVDTALIPHPASASPPWIELFGWIRQPVRYGSVESQILVDDSLQCLQMIREKVIPPVIDKKEPSGCNDTNDAASLEGDSEGSDRGENAAVDGNEDDEDDAGDDATSVRTAGTPSASRSSLSSTKDHDAKPKSRTERADHSPSLQTHSTLLHGHCVSACIASYSRHVRLLQDFLDELVNRIVFWKTRHLQSASLIANNSAHFVSSIADVGLREDILSILCNDIPPRLRHQISAFPTYLLASSNMTLNTLVAHHRRWFRNLSSHAWRPLQPPSQPRLCEWWLPGVITSVSIDHLIELSKRSFSHRRGIALDDLDQQFEVAFSLRVDVQTESDENDPGMKSTSSIQEEALDVTLAVFTGLELRIAIWDVERCYLQTLERSSSREPQRVSVFCRLEKRSPLDLASSSSVPSPRRRRQLATRSCPLMTRDSVAYEFPLPIGPAFGSLVSPYLCFSPP